MQEKKFKKEENLKSREFCRFPPIHKQTCFQEVLAYIKCGTFHYIAASRTSRKGALSSFGHYKRARSLVIRSTLG
jgi:hypothetical protein